MGIRWQDLLVVGLLLVIVTFFAMGGLGGASPAISILYAVGAYPFPNISPIVSSLILGTGTGNFLALLLRSHPQDPTRSATDFEFVAYVQPAIIAGTFLGVVGNAIFPSWLTLIVFVFVALVAVAKLLHKSWKMYNMKKQKQAAAAQAKADAELSEQRFEEVEEEAEVIYVDRTVSSIAPPPPVVGTVVVPVGEDEAKKPLGERLSLWWENTFVPRFKVFYKRYPLHAIIFLLLVWFTVLMMFLLMGSKKVASIAGIEKCSGAYWGIWAGTFIALIIATYVLAVPFFFTRRNSKLVKWTWWKVFLSPVLFWISGAVASLLGMGGALINNPLMIALGMHPQSMIATTSLSIVFTSSASVVQFFVAGKLTADYFIVMFLVGLSCSIVARVLAFKIAKSGNMFVVVLIGGIGIFCAMLVSLGVGIFKNAMQLVSYSFSSYC